MKKRLDLNKDGERKIMDWDKVTKEKTSQSGEKQEKKTREKRETSNAF